MFEMCEVLLFVVMDDMSYEDVVVLLFVFIGIVCSCVLCVCFYLCIWL